MEAPLRNTNWNGDTRYALGLYKYITKSIGIWPCDCQTILSKIQTILVIILEITMAISILSEINLNCGEVNDVIQMYSLAACCAIVIIKITSLRYNNKKILAIITSSIYDWETVTHPKALEIMKRNAKLARSVCLFQMISAYLTTVMIIIGPLPYITLQINATLNSSDMIFRPLPLRTVCFYGEMSTKMYSAVYILQAIQTLSTCTANIGCDCYFFGIALHVAGQFEWLGVEFETLNTKASENECRKSLATLVSKHNHLMQLSNYLEDSFHSCIFLILLVNTVQICLNGMQMIISVRTGDAATAINAVIIIYVMNLQIFLYSYAGDRLTSGIANLHVAIYGSTWYDLPQKTIKDLSFIMLRVNKAFNITAGKIYPMNIDSFKSIFKAMLSYFSVMQAMFEE
nr:olfactory receptor 144 [Microplitis mediator]